MATLCSSSSLWNGFMRLAKFQFLRLSLWPAPLIHLCRMPSFPATSQFKFQLDLALKPSDLFLSCFLSCTLLIIVISALISSPCFLFPCCLSIYVFPSFCVYFSFSSLCCSLCSPPSMLLVASHDHGESSCCFQTCDKNSVGSRLVVTYTHRWEQVKSVGKL